LTEEQWLAGTSPTVLLRHLGNHCRVTRVGGGRRRLRLFACACCRLVWDQFEDDRSRRAVEASESAADKRAAQEVRAAAKGAEAVYAFASRRRGARARCLAAAAWDATSHNFLSVEDAAINVVEAVRRGGDADAGRAMEARQAHLLRDIFANPFRQPVSPPAGGRSRAAGGVRGRGRSAGAGDLRRAPLRRAAGARRRPGRRRVR
jgi:hypothetical protein